VATGRRTPVFHKLTVSTVERLTDDAVTVTFEVPPECRADFDFAAGQHLTLRTDLDGAEVRRNYSICAPAGGGKLRVAVKELPGGAFSSYVNGTLRAGDVIDVLTPTGTFSTQLDESHTKHYAAIAAGSGITPVLSLLSTILAAEPRSRFTLLYGNRNARTVMFLDELADLKDRYPDRLHLVHVFSREAQDVPLFEGRIDPAKLERLLDSLLPPGDVDEWFLCGPFAMVEAVRPVLTGRGVDPHHVHFELFHVEDAPPPPRRAPDESGDRPTSEVTVILDGRTTKVPVERDGDRILDAVLRVRGDAPYACKGGVCGTCRAQLVTGQVEMEQCYALEEDEVAAGFVLTCQSHPVTAEVTLDYDR
jgi:ring-1,2-phenylacetyl-CoA epoxidase subunit PaaE